MIADSSARITADPLPIDNGIGDSNGGNISNIIGKRSSIDQGRHRNSISSVESFARKEFSFADNGEGVDPEYTTEIFGSSAVAHPVQASRHGHGVIDMPENRGELRGTRLGRPNQAEARA